jgi:hypothetical protein
MLLRRVRKTHSCLYWFFGEDDNRWLPVILCGTANRYGSATKIVVDPELVTCQHCIRLLRETGELK